MREGGGGGGEEEQRTSGPLVPLLESSAACRSSMRDLALFTTALTPFRSAFLARRPSFAAATASVNGWPRSPRERYSCGTQAQENRVRRAGCSGRRMVHTRNALFLSRGTSSVSSLDSLVDEKKSLPPAGEPPENKEVDKERDEGRRGKQEHQARRGGEEYHSQGSETRCRPLDERVRGRGPGQSHPRPPSRPPALSTRKHSEGEGESA